MNAELAIDVKGLEKSFGDKKVVKDFAIQVPKGMIFGFLGPNGSGKTTTIRMLCGLLTPDAGEGQCLGYDIRTQAQEIKSHVGYMTQRFGLYEDMTVRENLEFVGRMYGVTPLKQRVTEVMENHGLADRAEQMAGTLSGGWKQRLALTACILHEPQLLLLDEPTAGVDPNSRREFWEMIHDLSAKGVTILVSTHYMDEAERCHKIAYIAWGDLLLEGTIDEVVGQSGLVTWAVSGPDLPALQAKLRKEKGVEMAAAFGNELHVTGSNKQALEQAIAPYRDDSRYRWRPSEPSLEDVFIHTLTTLRERQ